MGLFSFNNLKNGVAKKAVDYLLNKKDALKTLGAMAIGLVKEEVISFLRDPKRLQDARIAVVDFLNDFIDTESERQNYVDGLKKVLPFIDPKDIDTYMGIEKISQLNDFLQKLEFNLREERKELK